MNSIMVQDVYKKYNGEQVLHNYSAVFPKGEITAILGASGSGKTTLTRLILGLEKPDAGSVQGMEGARLACVFQQDRLCSTYSAKQNVQLVLSNEDYSKAEEGLLRVGLSQIDIMKPVEQLSGGQQRRVALVRAMEAESDVIVLDEPFKGLDSEVKEKVYEYVAMKAKGKTVLLITHDLQEAERLARNKVEIPFAREKSGV